MEIIWDSVLFSSNTRTDSELFHVIALESEVSGAYREKSEGFFSCRESSSSF